MQRVGDLKLLLEAHSKTLKNPATAAGPDRPTVKADKHRTAEDPKVK